MVVHRIASRAGYTNLRLNRQKPPTQRVCQRVYNSDRKLSCTYCDRLILCYSTCKLEADDLIAGMVNVGYSPYSMHSMIAFFVRRKAAGQP